MKHVMRLADLLDLQRRGPVDPRRLPPPLPTPQPAEAKPTSRERRKLLRAAARTSPPSPAESAAW